MELLSNMKDVCVMERPNLNSGDWLVKSREQPPEGTTESVERDNKPSGTFKEQIAKLMQDYPAGIQLQELPILFKVQLGLYKITIYIGGIYM